MTISIFDTTEDAYWWILCTEKYFKAMAISEAEKMSTTARSMRGPALQWWNWWSPRHPQVTWDSFTTDFLWRFKPEWRQILPALDEEEEPALESLKSTEASSRTRDSVVDPVSNSEWNTDLVLCVRSGSITDSDSEEEPYSASLTTTLSEHPEAPLDEPSEAAEDAANEDLFGAIENDIGHSSDFSQPLIVSGTKPPFTVPPLSPNHPLPLCDTASSFTIGSSPFLDATSIINFEPQPPDKFSVPPLLPPRKLPDPILQQKTTGPPPPCEAISLKEPSSQQSPLFISEIQIGLVTSTPIRSQPSDQHMPSGDTPQPLTNTIIRVNKFNATTVEHVPPSDSRTSHKMRPIFSNLQYMGRHLIPPCKTNVLSLTAPPAAISFPAVSHARPTPLDLPWLFAGSSQPSTPSTIRVLQPNRPTVYLPIALFAPAYASHFQEPTFVLQLPAVCILLQHTGLPPLDLDYLYVANSQPVPEACLGQVPRSVLYTKFIFLFFSCLVFFPAVKPTLEHSPYRYNCATEKRALCIICFDVWDSQSISYNLILAAKTFTAMRSLGGKIKIATDGSLLYSGGDAIPKYVGPKKANLVVFYMICEVECLPVILCDTYGWGKLPLFALLASRLGITTVASIVSIKQLMSSFVHNNKHTLLWASTSQQVRRYDVDHTMFLTLSNTGIQAIVFVTNDMPLDVGQSKITIANWVARHVIAIIPAIVVGSAILITFLNASIGPKPNIRMNWIIFQHDFLKAKLCQKEEQQQRMLNFPVRIGNLQLWDPGGHFGMSKAVQSSQFKQWDPGKFVQGGNFHNLEDKVDFDGVGNVMILNAQKKNDSPNFRRIMTQQF